MSTWSQETAKNSFSSLEVKCDGMAASASFPNGPVLAS